MADTKISALPASTTPLAGTEVLPIVQSGATVKVAVDDLTVKNVRSNATNGILQIAGPAAAATRVMTTPDANFTAARIDAAQSFTGDQTLSTGNLVIGTSGKGINTSSAIPVTFNINSVEAARIHASGGVSIGNTTDPGATNLSVTGSVKSGTLTSGRVTYAGASGLLTDTSTFVFDGTNLGIGLTTPTSYAGYTGVTLLGGAAGAFLDLDNNLNTARFQLFTYAGATALNTINTNALTFGTQNTERMRVHASGGVSIGNTTDSGAASLNVSGLIFPQQAATASAPAYQKGAIYFDTTLNKLRVGGATDWETITSV